MRKTAISTNFTKNHEYRKSQPTQIKKSSAFSRLTDTESQIQRVNIYKFTGECPQEKEKCPSEEYRMESAMAFCAGKSRVNGLFMQHKNISLTRLSLIDMAL